MTITRFKAIANLSRRAKVESNLSTEPISKYFGEDVFDLEKMRHYLTKEVYESVCSAIDGGTRLDRRYADEVAAGVKTWAMERGVTHYSHWFQPLNESTAEKHDAFFEPIWGGGSFETFRGELLVQQEPDASSFPNGGLRNTFEARGYSAWDPSSPAFILDNTLCIPSIFVAYTGEALDYKTPLIKSLTALDEASVSVCQLFDKDVSKVTVTLGSEQEYFLVDEELYYARPDLVQTGRTLMGHTPAKDQQLEDHYFGSIPERVSLFMKDFEQRAYRLGIPLKTRHNEVAPCQFECAPMFEEANIAVDHNTLLMTIMRRTAVDHKLRVLFHEKPYDGVNGSGKHCNWAMLTNTGVNLFAPGRTPKNNMQFISFFVCAIKAAHDYGTLMMSSVASQTNAHRLGANEAPPTVMSVFTGSTLSDILDSIEERVSDSKLSPDEKTSIKLDIGKIPEILLDNTDRNRTSPFAFTGNRFEFRAVGSSASCAPSLIAINAGMTSTLKEFKSHVDELMGEGVKKDEAILQVVRRFIIESKSIRFEGNGYSREWFEEATEKRGLKSISNVTEAFGIYLDSEFNKALVDNDILSEVELQARYEIKNETFVKKLQIESRVLGDLAYNHIIPIAIAYQNVLVTNIKGLKELFEEEEYKEMAFKEIKITKAISMHVKEIRNLVSQMTSSREKGNAIKDIVERAKFYNATVEPYLYKVRRHIDVLELIVDNNLWPLPKYRELMEIR